MGICFILAGCDKDDNEESEILLTSQELIQTTWDAELYKYNENLLSSVPHHQHGIR